MKYKLLSSLYYKNKNEYNQVYKNRYSSESTYRFEFEVKGNKSFVLIDNEMLSKVEKINKLYYEKQLCFNTLPPLAIEEYTKKSLIDEVTITNEIEGIVSTRKEINDILIGKGKAKRFSDITKSYKQIFSNKYNLNSCQSVRKIYDDVVLSDIKKNDYPDGELFRKEKVYVRDRRQNNIHIGLMPENKIISVMNECLVMLNSNEFNSLIKIAVFHYMFGYIHPFYDGNGRTSRFITSYLLSKEFKGSLGSSVSKAIASEKDKYYKAFKVCNDEKNLGDLTFFILTFFEILIAGLEDDLNSMQSRKQQLDFYNEALEDYSVKHQAKGKLLNILIQNKLFGEQPVSIVELVKYSGLSDVNIRGKIAELESEKLVIKTKRSRAYVYSLDLGKIQ
jgi:Fic family protein